MSNPVVHRELTSVLRSGKGLAVQLVPAMIFSVLVLLRWPGNARIGLSGSQAVEVFRMFGYGLLATLLVVVPVYPATSIVREKIQGTMALLLNTLMGAWSIYWGKMLGVLGFVFLPLAMSLPAAAACYAMGGISLTGHLLPLYGVLALVTVQYAAVGLFVSSRSGSTDGAVRITYGIVLLMAVLCLGPHLFLQGKSSGMLVMAAELLRCVSPIPAVMEILGQGDTGSHGMIAQIGTPWRYAILAVLSTFGLMVMTAAGLKQTMFDRPRPQGTITDDRGLGGRFFRRTVFIFDPQRRNRAIGRFTNPVMIKEFRSRRFGRSHWMARLVAGCAVVSLLLTFAAAGGTLDWGVETIGGIMVLLQAALIIVVTPALAAGLISSEHENGGWLLLRMTPLSAVRIVSGKLISVFWPLMLLLMATLPGYAVMMWILPVLAQQILYVLITLVLTSLFALMLSAMVSSFFRRTSPATVTSYALLGVLCGTPLLIWLGRDAPFGHDLVESVLRANPVAAGLSLLEISDFAQYNLVPTNWYILASATVFCLIVLCVQTHRLTRPQ